MSNSYRLKQADISAAQIEPAAVKARRYQGDSSSKPAGMMEGSVARKCWKAASVSPAPADSPPHTTLAGGTP